jgi:hypothetical protein
MKTDDKPTKQGTAVLLGTPALDLYLKEINWNLRSMMAQADVLETTLNELTKEHPEYLAAPASTDNVRDMITGSKP